MENENKGTEETKGDIIQNNMADICNACFVMKTVKGVHRQKIMSLLLANGSMCVTQISAEMKMLQPIVSQNLAMLRKANLVRTERDGRKVLYSVNQECLEKIINKACQLAAEMKYRYSNDVW